MCCDLSAAVPHDKKSREALALQIYQYCIQPRAKLSLPDAAFCYAFIKRLHSSNTLNFHTLVLFDKVSERGDDLMSEQHT